jgi:predicted transposase/invertase (TIGR01784 family)
MTQIQGNELPDPMSDVFTASLWSAPKNEHLLLSFINSVRTNAGALPIVKATVLNPFNIKEFEASKGIILDVRAKDEHDHLYDVEVQTSNHPAFPNRSLDYWSDTYTAQLKSGMDYRELRRVISIILTSFKIFPQLEDVHTIFQITAKENPKVLLTDAFQMHYLRLYEVIRGHLGKLDSLCLDLRHWFIFFAFGGSKTEEEMSALTNSSPIILEAYSEMQRFYANPETREKARERRRFLVDFNLGMNASKAEGRAEGRAEGKAEGRVEGKAESIVLTLSRRFNNVSQEIQGKLLGLRDIDQINDLANFAYDCQSLDEFASHLR